MTLAELSLGTIAVVVHVNGKGSFRRRLMELGILPGTRVELVGVAPLGDPLELLVRGASLSIRRSEAAAVEVRLASEKVESSVHSAPAVDAGSLVVGHLRSHP